MDRKVSETIKNIIMFAAVFVLVFASASYFGKVYRPTETDINVRQIETFHELPKDSVEVMCYGSSRMWRGLDVMEMYKEYGIGAYNYGCNWQHINTTNLFLHDSLRSQSPKLVIIDTGNANLPLMDVNMDGEIYYTRKIPWSITKYKCVRQYFGRGLERYVAYFLPLAAFHENWQNVDEKSFADDDNVHVDFLTDVDDVDQDIFHTTMGFGPTDIATEVTIGNPDDFAQLPFEKYATDVLDDIVSTCRSNGADILFITMPYEGEYAYNDAMEEYAKNNGCNYVNLYYAMDDMGIDCSTDFCDHSHFNSRGAAKAADYIGKYIIEHYNLTDYRTVTGNLWDEALGR